MATCPACGHENPDTNKFCGECATPLASPVEGALEERKVVSILFVDLVGFTARSDQADPEDVRARLRPYQAMLRREIERFGGTAEKFIGDAVMAVFGAPVAHEDDAERAVRCALRISDAVRELNQEQPGLELSTRAAVNTGEAVVALGARPERGEGMVTGDVVNTASRLQGVAPTGGVVVGGMTYRATRDAIDYEELAPVVVKGKVEPVSLWHAVRARSRFATEIERAAGPFVGRANELGLLTSTLARVREERAPQLVTLVGVPGIGKSRLVFELFQTVERDVALVRWRQGRSLPYGEGVTFWALAEIVKAEAGILESDTVEQAGAKIARTVAQLGLPASESPWLERHLRPLVGLGEEGSASPEEGFAAWRRFLEALAEQRPLVIVFEDLHWSDDALLDFVDSLVERASGVPLLVLGTARPELLQRRAGWGGGKPNALTISLSPLSDEETAQLVEVLLARQLVERRTQEELLARAGGNPLYAEQYVRILLDRGSLGELPETVQGIIAARLDALSPDEKRLLQDAAVVGRVFWLGAIEAVGGATRWKAEELLHALARKEFVQRSHSSAVGGEREYSFRHLLIRDIAYGQIPRAERVEKHRRAAVWIESLGRPEDQAEMLAHHYLQALELAEAAGMDVSSLGEAARVALRDAGDRAAGLHAFDAARRFYEAALGLWPADDPERADVLLRRAAPTRIWGDLDADELEEARDALLAVGHRDRAAEAEQLLSLLFWNRGQHELSDEHAKRAIALLADAAPSRAAVWVLMRDASLALLASDTATALARALEARDMVEDLGGQEGLADVLTILGMARVQDGDGAGCEEIARSTEVATATGELGALARAHNDMAVAHQILGNLDAAFASRSEGARVAARLGTETGARWFQGVLCDQHFRRGAWDEALGLADDFLAAVESGSPHYLAWQAYSIRGEIRLARGEVEGPAADAERALAAGRAAQDSQALYFVLATCAHLQEQTGRPDRAEALADELLEALRTDAEMLSVAAVISLPVFAATAHRLGRSPQLLEALAEKRTSPWTESVSAYASEDFARAAEAFRRIGTKPDEAEARMRLAEVLFARGGREEAEKQLRQAMAFYRSVGATRYVGECEALLASVG